MRPQPTFLSKQALEAKAEDMLRAYRGNDSLVDPTPLDIDSFAEFHLQATIDYHQLSADGSVLGMSVFQELAVPTLGDGAPRADVISPLERS